MASAQIAKKERLQLSKDTEDQSYFAEALSNLSTKEIVLEATIQYLPSNFARVQFISTQPSFSNFLEPTMPRIGSKLYLLGGPHNTMDIVFALHPVALG